LIELLSKVNCHVFIDTILQCVKHGDAKFGGVPKLDVTVYEQQTFGASVFTFCEGFNNIKTMKCCYFTNSSAKNGQIRGKTVPPAQQLVCRQASSRVKTSGEG